MATKAKTLQVKDKEKDDKAADAPEKDSPDAPSPLLDLSDAAVKKMIKQAKVLIALARLVAAKDPYTGSRYGV